MSDPHTPLPWRFSPWHIEEGEPAVRAPTGHIVATTAGDGDAMLIVRSVNALPALVKALEKISDGSTDPYGVARTALAEFKEKSRV